MLTPIDIQNHSLKTAVRGYSKKETDDFLDEILTDYEAIYKENRELKEKVASLSEGIQYYKQMETTLQKALVLAEKTSAETQEAAKSKAEAMTGEAQAKAEAILKEAKAEAEAMKKEIQAYSDITKSKANHELEDTRNHVRKLVQSYENYRLQFKKLAESQIEMLESKHYSIFAPELAEMLDGAPDADTVMDAERTVPINASENYYDKDKDDEVSSAANEDEPDRNAADGMSALEEDLAKDMAAATEELAGSSGTMTDENVKDSSETTPAVEGNEGQTAEDVATVTEESALADANVPVSTNVPPVSATAAVPETTTAVSDADAKGQDEKKEFYDKRIKIPDMEITADTIVPGIVLPKETDESSPFTFIDP